ncbi:LuxR C-terminal-related transcriptional regulator [Gordonia sp. NPDC003424]
MEYKLAHGAHSGRPAIPPGYVRRRRIDEALSDGITRPVTVVSAGPGYGKTLAVAAWAERVVRDRPLAWMVADATGSVRAFWTAALTALRSADALPDDHVLNEMAPGAEFGDTEVARIADELTALDRPVILVIDDFHLVTDPALLDSIAGLIDHRPAGLRLILISRTQPALRFSRLQMSGGVTEIHADQLSFTRDEVREFCERAGAAVTSADVDAIVERTEGWPAGLRLLLLSADGGDLQTGLRRFNGQQRLVAAYLLEEVLDKLPPSDRKFLLATSVVDPVSGDLARALIGRRDSRQVLEDLVATNSLTVRLSDRPDWFRYHPLLRGLLQDRLRAENPDSALDLHRRAARWYLGAGDPIAALEHYALAGDWDDMLTTLAGTALPLILSSQAPALAAALAPAEVENARRPSLPTMLIAAIAEFHRHEYGAMERNAEDAEVLLGGTSEAEAAPARLVIGMVHMVYARLARLADLVDRAEEVMRTVDGLGRPMLPAAEGLALIAENNRAIGLAQRGELELAAAELEVCRKRGEAAGLGLMALAASSYLALIDLVRGQFPEVERRVTETFALAELRGWSREPQVTALYATLAWMHLERNELDAAEVQIAIGRSVGAERFDGGAWLMMEVIAVRVAVGRHDVFGARAGRASVQAWIEQAGPLPALLERWSRAALADVDLLEGQIPELPPVGGGGDPSGYATGVERVLQARVYLARGRPADALHALGSPSHFAPYRVLAVKAAVFSAVAAHQLRRDALAIERIDEAVRLAAPIGVLRPFLIAGDTVPMLLTRRQHVGASDRDFVAKVLAACGGPSGEAEVDALVADDLLTERELVVLRYLPTMYKASEIAADLFVSVNTVKTHQQAIYRKLGVSTRRDAVDRARVLNLL